MAKAEFPFRVKYEGRFYAPHEVFEAKDEDAGKLTALGAKVLAQKQEKPESASKPNPESKPVGRPAKSSRPYKIPSPEKKG